MAENYRLDMPGYAEMQAAAQLGYGSPGMGGFGGMTGMQQAGAFLPFAAPALRPGASPMSTGAMAMMPGMLGATFAHPTTPIAGPVVSGMLGQGLMGLGAGAAFPDIRGAGGALPGGFGLGAGAMAGMGGALGGMVGQGSMGPTMGDIAGIGFGAGQAGFFRGVPDVRRAREQMLNMVQQVTSLSRELSMTIEQVTTAMGSLRGLGYTGVGAAAAGVRDITRISGAAGLPPEQVMGLMQSVGNQVRAAGGVSMGSATGAMGGALQTVGAAFRGGYITDDQLLNATGETGERGVAAFSTRIQESGLRFLKSTPGKFLAAAAMQIDPETGAIGVNQDFIKRLWRGDVGREELTAAAHRNVNQLGGVGEWWRYRDRAAGNLLNATQGMGGALLARSVFGADPNDPRTWRRMQQQTGMNMQEMETMMPMMANMGQIQGEARLTEANQQRQAAFNERANRATSGGNLQYVLREATRKYTENTEQELQRLIDENMQHVVRRLESSMSEISGALDPQAAGSLSQINTRGAAPLTGTGHLFTGNAAVNATAAEGSGVRAANATGQGARSYQAFIKTMGQLGPLYAQGGDATEGTAARRLELWGQAQQQLYGISTTVEAFYSSVGDSGYGRTAGYLGNRGDLGRDAASLSSQYGIDTTAHSEILKNYADTASTRRGLESGWYRLQNAPGGSATFGALLKSKGLPAFDPSKDTMMSYMGRLNAGQKAVVLGLVGAGGREVRGAMSSAIAADAAMRGLSTANGYSSYAMDVISGVGAPGGTDPSALREAGELVNDRMSKSFGSRSSEISAVLLGGGTDAALRLSRYLDGGGDVTGMTLKAALTAAGASTEGFGAEALGVQITSTGALAGALTAAGQLGQASLAHTLRGEGGVFSSASKWEAAPTRGGSAALGTFRAKMGRYSQGGDINASLRSGANALMGYLAVQDRGRGGRALGQYDISVAPGLEEFAEARTARGRESGLRSLLGMDRSSTGEELYKGVASRTNLSEEVVRGAIRGDPTKLAQLSEALGKGALTAPGAAVPPGGTGGQQNALGIPLENGRMPVSISADQINAINGQTQSTATQGTPDELTYPVAPRSQ